MRDLTAAMEEVCTADTVKPILLFAAYLDEETLYMWSGRGSISWNGQTWLGTGNFLKAAQITETQEVQATGTQYQLSGVASEMIALVLATKVKGRLGELYFGTFDNSTGLIVEDPVLLHRGRLDAPNIALGAETITITVNAESKMVDLDRAREFRYTHEDQQIFYPGDKFFEFVPSLQEKQISF